MPVVPGGEAIPGFEPKTDSPLLKTQEHQTEVVHSYTRRAHDYTLTKAPGLIQSQYRFVPLEKQTREMGDENLDGFMGLSQLPPLRWRMSSCKSIIQGDSWFPIRLSNKLLKVGPSSRPDFASVPVRTLVPLRCMPRIIHVLFSAVKSVMAHLLISYYCR